MLLCPSEWGRVGRPELSHRGLLEGATRSGIAWSAGCSVGPRIWTAADAGGRVFGRSRSRCVFLLAGIPRAAGASFSGGGRRTAAPFAGSQSWADLLDHVSHAKGYRLGGVALRVGVSQLPPCCALEVVLPREPFQDGCCSSFAAALRRDWRSRLPQLFRALSSRQRRSRPFSATTAVSAHQRRWTRRGSCLRPAVRTLALHKLAQQYTIRGAFLFASCPGRPFVP